MTEQTRFVASKSHRTYWVVWDRVAYRAADHYMGPGARERAEAKAEMLNRQDEQLKGRGQ